MALAAVLKYADEEIRVYFTFHRPTIEALKALRVGARWDKEGSYWAAPEDMTLQIVYMLEALGYVWELSEDKPARPLWSDVLFERAPRHLQPSLFRAVAQVVHPDHDGDEAMMRELTDAGSRLAELPLSGN